ncbi:hypothetical protein L1I79_22335 [Strepomyces sp. STD 3.1]|nr:hypothetical protein [Streptomyces sp. STD 3.1]
MADGTGPTALTGLGWALPRTADRLSSALVGLYGWGDGGEDGSEGAVVVRGRAGQRLRAVLGGTGPADRRSSRGRSVHVSLVALSRDTVHP